MKTSVTEASSLSQKPNFWDRLMNEFSLKWSAAEHMPDQAGIPYVTLATTVARNTSCSDVTGMQWLRRTRTAYRRLEQDDIIFWHALWQFYETVAGDDAEYSKAGDSLDAQTLGRKLNWTHACWTRRKNKFFDNQNDKNINSETASEKWEVYEEDCQDVVDKMNWEVDIQYMVMQSDL